MVATIILSTDLVSANSNSEEPPSSWIGNTPNPHRCPQPQRRVSTSYNTSSTALTVKFPAKSSGKVEIYRNGTQVVNVSAAAGTSLNYMLRNYGTGSYTVIVSCGNTVVFSNNVEVK